MLDTITSHQANHGPTIPFNTGFTIITTIIPQTSKNATETAFADVERGPLPTTLEVDPLGR